MCSRNKALRGFIDTITMLYLKGADQILSKVAEMREMLGVSSCHHSEMGDAEKQRGERVTEKQKE